MIEIKMKNIKTHDVREVAAAYVRNGGDDYVLLRTENEDGYVSISESGEITYLPIARMYENKSFEEICDSWDYTLIQIFEEESDFTFTFTAE